ncbi:MAG TPA: ankyrin repeat domain-containing protein [Pyrinomonadaceae bacterium]|nr:ankyrin repeat domain-containing protein [Pyrinomonadaceae bacterium]
MSKKSFIDEIKVKDPCTQDWETMRGNDYVRFCDHCSKNVTDISKMTRKRALKLVRETNGKLCIRYLENPRDNSPMFADRFVRLTRRAPSLATGVMSASLVLSNAAYAQGSIASRAPQQQVSKEEKSLESASAEESKKPDPMSELSGTVTDPVKAVISGATVKMTTIETRSERTTFTDENGKYSLSDLTPGKYDISISSPGFRVNLHSGVNVSYGKVSTLDATLEVGGATMGGVMFAIPEYDSPLNQAIENDDIDAFREAIAGGERVNFKEKDNGNITPLFVAVDNGNVEMARMLLDLGAKVNARDSQRQTPLMLLDDDSNAQMVELLLQFGAKIDLEDKEGNTALILAAENAEAEVVEALLKGGPDVNATNDEGQTALMNAAYVDDLETVRLLLNAGADVKAKNDDGETAWDQTSEKEIEDLLVSFGAVTKEKNPDDMEDHEVPTVEDEPVNP